MLILRDEDPQCLGDGNGEGGAEYFMETLRDVALTQISEHEVYHDLGADGNRDRASWICLINAVLGIGLQNRL